MNHPPRAGLEHKFSIRGGTRALTKEEMELIFKEERPGVIKKPGLFDAYRKAGYLTPEVLKTIDICIVPIRGIEKAMASRTLVTALGFDEYGGLHKGAVTEDTHAQKLGWDIETCVMNDIPFVFLKYPQFSKDASYCHEQLKSLFKPRNITVDDVQKAFDTIGIKEPRV